MSREEHFVISKVVVMQMSAFHWKMFVIVSRSVHTGGVRPGNGKEERRKRGKEEKRKEERKGSEAYGFKIKNQSRMV